MTRASTLTLAADRGYQVEERKVPIEELLAWADHGEAFLSGTAAVIAPVGKIVIGDDHIQLGDGQPGENTLKLRQALVDIQIGASEDRYGWRTTVAG